MVNQQKINDKITLGGLLEANDAAHLKEQGFAGVINLVTPEEPSYDEKSRAEAVGLEYASIPVSPQLLDDATLERFIQQVESSDGPVIVHCKSGGRASLMTLLYLGITHGWSLERTLEEGQKFDGKIDKNSPYYAFFEHAIKNHSAGERE